jgi:hypothetical protein
VDSLLEKKPGQGWRLREAAIIMIDSDSLKTLVFLA